MKYISDEDVAKSDANEDDITSIEIDCYNNEVRTKPKYIDIMDIKYPIETLKSQLIANLIAPKIIKLCKLSKEELMRKSIQQDRDILNQIGEISE